MNLHIVVGIVLIALGTTVMTYGQYIKRKADSAVLASKIERALTAIDETRKSAPNAVAAEKIQDVEEEFRTWAATFSKERERKKVAFAQTQLASDDLQLAISGDLRPIYQHVLDTIDALAHAYREETSEAVSTMLTPVPVNLYSKDASDYVGTVVFPSGATWRITFLASKPARRGNAPTMYLSFEPRRGDETVYHSVMGSFVSITHTWDSKGLKIALYGPDVPAVEQVEGVYTLNEYPESLNMVMRRLFEAQLLRD